MDMLDINIIGLVGLELDDFDDWLNFMHTSKIIYAGLFSKFLVQPFKILVLHRTTLPNCVTVDSKDSKHQCFSNDDFLYYTITIITDVDIIDRSPSIDDISAEVYKTVGFCMQSCFVLDGMIYCDFERCLEMLCEKIELFDFDLSIGRFVNTKPQFKTIELEENHDMNVSYLKKYSKNFEKDFGDYKNIFNSAIKRSIIDTDHFFTVRGGDSGKFCMFCGCEIENIIDHEVKSNPTGHRVVKEIISFG